MKILIDINHPAHVHLFKHAAYELLKKGHDVRFTTRNKEIAHILLEKYDFKYTSFGRHYKKLAGKLWGIIKFDIRLFLIARRFKPDLFLSMGSIYASHVSYLTGIPHILLQDTENATLQHKLSIPFADTVLNPKCFKLRFKGNKQIFYEGYHELAYLHPKYFTPDPKVLNKLDINENEKFILMRFVSWSANHDLGHSGISTANKLKAVKEFSKYARVFISSEQELIPELRKYKITIPPEEIHHVMAYASLLYGESATMASECAMMGVPSIFIDQDGRGYTDELEKEYGIVFNFSESSGDQLKSIEKGIEILKKQNIKQEFSESYKRLMKDKINVTDFLIWFIQDFPNTKNQIRSENILMKRFKI